MKEIEKPALMKLKGMIGQTFLYKGKQITISNYHVLPEEGKTQVDIDNGDPIKTPDLNKFIEFCLPVDTDDEISNLNQTDSLLVTLQNTLLDNINQVKTNPNYIKQANTINSSVNSLIGLAKIQLSVKKLKRDI